MNARRNAVALVLCLVAAACSGPAGDSPQTVSAIFPTASNLFVGSEVRVMGIQVGQVTDIVPEGPTVRVVMEVTQDQPLPADVGAALVPMSLLGERIIQLEPPYTGGPKFDGEVIGIERTAVPAEVDQVLRSFQSFASALDEEVLAKLIDTAAETLEGQGEGLNQLIDQGAETVEVLDESSGDLNGLVTELGALNQTLATRDEKIGRTLERLSSVMQIFAEEKGNIIGSIEELRRFTAELQPLVDEHTGPLVRDLDVLTTTLSTVDRNLARVAETYRGTNTLFEEFAPQATDYENGRANLYNLTDQLFTVIELRLAERLEGVCLRLGIQECNSSMFWMRHIPAITCVDGAECAKAQTTMGEALAQALGEMPEDGRRKLVRDARRRARESREQQAEQEAQSPPSASPEPSDEEPDEADDSPLPEPVLPLPDPRLESLRKVDP